MQQLLGVELTEIQKAYDNGMRTVGEDIYQTMLRRKYGVEKSLCYNSDRNCLYIYLYALGEYLQGRILPDVNYLSILVKIEELQRACCEIEYPETKVDTSIPRVHDGIWIQDEVTNPLTIAELAETTVFNGTLLWYTAFTGGTGTTAPALDDTYPHQLYYWVSQTANGVESARVRLRVTVLPVTLIRGDFIACQTDSHSYFPTSFNNLTVGTIRFYNSAGTYIGDTLTIDSFILQNDSYSATQTVNGLESQPLYFTVRIKPRPGMPTDLQGNVTPLENTQYTYTVPAIQGYSYQWAVDGGGYTGSSTTNSINITFTSTGTRIVKCRYIQEGCTGPFQTLEVEVEEKLNGVHFTYQDGQSMTGRIFEIDQHLIANTGDTVTITSAVVDNPVGATITVTPLILSGGNDLSSHVTIDGTGTYTGGTVVIKLTITNSVLGAPIDSPDTVLISIVFDALPHCQPGYTLSQDGTYCYMIDVIPATVTQSNYCLAANPYKDYGINGARIYNSGFSNASISSFTPVPGDVLAEINTPIQWRNTTGLVGPMNRSAVWVDSNCDGTVDPLASGNQCTIAAQLVNNGPSRQVYIGIGVDNVFDLKVNGSSVAMVTDPIPVSHFRLWHLFPVILQNGLNNINTVATGDGSTSDAIGVTVYDNTAQELINAQSDNGLDILFTTANFIGTTIDIATCPVNYSLDTTNGPGNYLCTRTLTTPPLY